MIINHNLAANNAIRFMNSNSANASKSMQKLSSGLRINSASDDAAGLAISEKMRGQIRGLDQASSNSQDAISLIGTAEGALNETHSILQRMRELSVQAATDTNTATDRSEIQKEVTQLTSEIDRIANTTEFNTKKLLTGSIGVSTTDGANITQLASTADTKAGTLSFTANGTMAKAASGDLVLTAGVTTASAAGTLNITANGKTYNVGFSAGQSMTDIAKNISSVVDGYTATFDAANHKISFTSNVADADQTLTVAEATATTLDGTIDLSSIAANGIDTANAVNGVKSANASGLVSAGSTFSYQGNEVTVTSGNFTGLKFTLAADAGSTTTASVSGKSITVNQSLTFQIGANKDQNLSLAINAMDSQNLGVSAIDVTTQSGANNAIELVNNAIESVSSERSKLGAYQNRLEHTIANLGTSSENLTSSESRIRDVDMAKEMSAFSKNNILAQAAQAMLAQANQQPQQVLQLLR
ncbi:flagellin protein FlaA [Clostridium sp. YIM B02515]|uniref:Flagellin n=1 Tax=Clostridium rhizosphaerae TaxID=2803861 RepID=A0ABS1TJ63_9CLOT|nr:flagellin [Clostridium rhizosphaerae]MBL4938003.1 flagellin protein FlaA [Clostridium rhizosphaerae]